MIICDSLTRVAVAVLVAGAAAGGAGGSAAAVPALPPAPELTQVSTGRLD